MANEKRVRANNVSGDALGGESVTVHAEITAIKETLVGSTLRKTVDLSLFEV